MAIIEIILTSIYNAYIIEEPAALWICILHIPNSGELSW